MKTIKQLSAELEISKEAIYKKLKYQLKEQLTGHVHRVENVTQIDGEGERIIRQSLYRERREAIEGVMDISVPGETGNEPHLTEYVSLLKEQIKTKDIQLESQSGHISLLIRQLGNVHFLNQAEHIKNLLLTTTAEAPVFNNPPKQKSIFRRFFKDNKI